MRKYNLIIVENDEDEQFFMQAGFDTANLFNVVAKVKNGEGLFKWLSENNTALPDVILSDLNMPGKNGYEIIVETKHNPAYKHIPVIITSTSSTKSIIDKCISVGAAAYIVKPETFVKYAPFVEKLYKIICDEQLVK